MNKRFITLCVLFLFGSFVSSYAQTDSISQPIRVKIDGVAAVIGDYVILDSDVDKAYIDLEYLKEYQHPISKGVVFWVN